MEEPTETSPTALQVDGAGREIELPAGPLGLVFQAGSTKIKEVKRDSAVKAACDAGDRCIAFRPPGGEERVDCRDMTDTEFVKLLTAHKDTPGRVMYVMKPGDSMTDTSSDGRVAPAAGELTRELFAAIRAKNKDRVRELLEMGADVNAYEPAPDVRARDLRCVSLSPGPDRARD